MALGAATAGAAEWSGRQLAADTSDRLPLFGIDCPSPQLCVAVTFEGLIYTSTNPTGNAPAWQITDVDGDGPNTHFYGISCPSTTFCAASAGDAKILTSTNPTGGPGAWTTTQLPGPLELRGISCASAALCLAVDNNGDVLASTDPDGGSGDWTFANILPFPSVEETQLNAFWGASCPSRSFCAIAAMAGTVFTSTNPFEVSAPVPVSKDGKKKSKKRVKRPRVRIAAAPPPAVETTARKVTVRFRFFARNHAFVRGYLCKLDKRPTKRCRSPKPYRVGLGRHVFRVRAIGFSGLRGRVETWRFKICRPTPYGNCMRHLPRGEQSPLRH